MLYIKNIQTIKIYPTINYKKYTNIKTIKIYPTIN